MSCADIFASSAMALSSFPIDKDSPLTVFGAKGTRKTCQAQGFFVQFFAISLFCNLGLSTYSFLSVGRGWSERQMRRVQYWFYGVPVVVGMTLAIYGIPFYKNVAIFCHIDVPPLEAAALPIVMLLLVPDATVSVLATAMMGFVYIKVRHQTQRTARWHFRASSSSISRSPARRGRSSDVQASRDRSLQLDRQVFWHSVFYLSAFYATHTVQFYAVLNSWLHPQKRFSGQDSYLVWLLFTVLTPLQGFWNAFIYFRPRFLQELRRRKRQAAVNNGKNPDGFPLERDTHEASASQKMKCEERANAVSVLQLEPGNSAQEVTAALNKIAQDVDESDQPSAPAPCAP
mmetsp:Transcript_4658/g.8081  ORF Transcript_4658/g.8081 Transcript_4658/m.8081 type:complete len:344 (-) Transcript_4658:476-1507(-)